MMSVISRKSWQLTSQTKTNLQEQEEMSHSSLSRPYSKTILKSPKKRLRWLKLMILFFLQEENQSHKILTCLHILKLKLHRRKMEKEKQKIQMLYQKQQPLFQFSSQLYQILKSFGSKWSLMSIPTSR